MKFGYNVTRTSSTSVANVEMFISNGCFLLKHKSLKPYNAPDSPIFIEYTTKISF